MRLCPYCDTYSAAACDCPGARSRRDHPSGVRAYTCGVCGSVTFPVFGVTACPRCDLLGHWPAMTQRPYDWEQDGEAS